jgi:hypothetical protein
MLSYADVWYIQAAAPYAPAARAEQRQMLDHYVRAFRVGDIQHHKNAQRAWVKDMGPPGICFCLPVQVLVALLVSLALLVEMYQYW